MAKGEKILAFEQARCWANATGQPQNVVRLKNGGYASLPASENYSLQFWQSELVSRVEPQS